MLAEVDSPRIQVIDDGDRGPNLGEIHWRYFVDCVTKGSGAFHKYSTGDVFRPKVTGTPHLVVKYFTPASRDALIGLLRPDGDPAAPAMKCSRP